MRILIAPDKFKGTLDACGVAEAIGGALSGHEIVRMPVADGGEGTARVIGEALGGQHVQCAVRGPLGEVVQAEFWVTSAEDGAGAAVMEMSSASGLALSDAAARDPWRASTYGTGELLLAARAAAVDEILIGIGGSATNDGGAGLAAALGYRFIAADGKEVDDIPAELLSVDALFPDLAVDVPAITVACDVTNPLLGDSGATQVFGAQKGIRSEEVERHEKRLAHFASLVETEFGRDFRSAPGAGAAGGLGFGLMSLCDAALRPGFEVVADVIGLERAVAEADLVITGEGCLDAQTLMGKAPIGVAAMARAAGKPVVAFCGRVEDAEKVGECFDAVFPLVEEGDGDRPDLEGAGTALKIKVAQALPLLERWAP